MTAATSRFIVDKIVGKFVVAVLLASVLVACGQKRDLYLLGPELEPSEREQAPVNNAQEPASVPAQ